MTVTSSRSRDDRAAIDKAVSLLVSFGDQANTGLGVSELARRSGLSKSTAFRVLGSLERNGVVERVGSDYRLGRRLLELGTRVYAPEADRIRDVLTPFLADLYELTHETVHLAALHGTDVVYLAKLYGHRPAPSPSRVGGCIAAYCTAVGKALLAYDHEAATRTLRSPLRPFTARTLCDPTRLSEHLDAVRRDGIAFDHEEALAGLTCVAVPVLGPAGRAVAALSVSGATGRFDPYAQAGALRRVSHAASQALRRARRLPAHVA